MSKYCQLNEEGKCEERCEHGLEKAFCMLRAVCAEAWKFVGTGSI